MVVCQTCGGQVEAPVILHSSLHLLLSLQVELSVVLIGLWTRGGVQQPASPGLLHDAVKALEEAAPQVEPLPKPELHYLGLWERSSGITWISNRKELI